jgi:hypothetical protein
MDEKKRSNSLHIYITKSIDKEFREKCEEENVRMSNVLNEFIEYFIKHGKRVFYLIQKGGDDK